ncbi:AraC family transcriptional regulator [Rufibacter sediminis]|nr:helix-turn-helix domain-containing protein [Rufibacter sediminis]
MAVPAEFEEVFTHFYISGNNTGETIHKTFLPSFQTMMVFSFGSEVSFRSDMGNRIQVGKCIILGPVKQSFGYEMPSGAEILVANFRDDAFYRFFGQLPSAGQTPIEPDGLHRGNCFTELWYLLKGIDPDGRVPLILDFCRPYLKDRESAFGEIMPYRDASAAFNPIKVIAKATKQSERTIQLNHRKYLGYTAKEISRYRRFLKAVDLLQNDLARANWFEIIDACGYYDQSQLIHDFKHYLHLSPKQYLKFHQDVCR